MLGYDCESILQGLWVSHRVRAGYMPYKNVFITSNFIGWSYQSWMICWLHIAAQRLVIVWLMKVLCLGLKKGYMFVTLWSNMKINLKSLFSHFLANMTMGHWDQMVGYSFENISPGYTTHTKTVMGLVFTMAFAWKASHGHVATHSGRNWVTISLNRREQTCLQSLQLK